MSNFGGGDIPIGDTLRIDKTSTTDNTEATILNKTGAGIVTSIWLAPNLNLSENIVLKSLKVTVDGATERQLIASDIYIRDGVSNVGAAGVVMIPGIWIKYKTSLVIKMTWQDASGSNTSDVVVVNHVG